MGKDVAVVTGASGGIGRAIAKMIHEKSEGELRICLHCRGNRGSAEELQKEIPGSFVLQADLATPEGRRKLLEGALEKGHPYVLVNNAGVDKPHEPALMIQESSFDEILGANLKSAAFLMRDFGKEMAGAGAGVIVNMSSVLANKALIGSALYRASKAALEALTRQFAAELGPKGVRVNAVAPGFIETPMTQGIPPETRDKIRSETALGAFGAPEAVAQAVCHLIENDYINGAVLPVNGGMSL